MYDTTIGVDLRMKVALVDDSGSLLMMAMEANKRRLGQLKNSDNRQAYLKKTGSSKLWL